MPTALPWVRQWLRCAGVQVALADELVWLVWTSWCPGSRHRLQAGRCFRSSPLSGSKKHGSKALRPRGSTLTSFAPTAGFGQAATAARRGSLRTAFPSRPCPAQVAKLGLTLGCATSGPGCFHPARRSRTVGSAVRTADAVREDATAAGRTRFSPTSWQVESSSSCCRSRG